MIARVLLSAMEKSFSSELDRYILCKHLSYCRNADGGLNDTSTC